jgi:PHP family Zn ribbon phosphoesterase
MEAGEIKRIGGERLAEAITRMRAGEVSMRPGFDGEFGHVRLTETVSEARPAGPVQAGLF